MSDTWGSGNLPLTLSVPSPARLLETKEIQITSETHPQPTHNNPIKIGSPLESEGKKRHRYLSAKPGVSAPMNAKGFKCTGNISSLWDYWSSPVGIRCQWAVTGGKTSQERHKNRRDISLTSCFQVHSWVQLQEGKLEAFLQGRQENSPVNSPSDQPADLQSLWLPILRHRGQGEVILTQCLCSGLASKNPSRNRSSL